MENKIKKKEGKHGKQLKKRSIFGCGRTQTSPLTLYYINIYRQQRTCAQIYKVYCTLDCILRSE
jgi:hypothetical protein